MSKSDKQLWKCPKCGHEFVTKNLWHSCGRYSLADHFEGSDPRVRELFDRFTAMVEACGPVTIYPQQTRIVCQVRVRFAGVVPRQRDLDVGVWLARPVQHPKLRRTELIPPSTFVHHFRFKQPAELDEAFMAIVQEGYAVGRQEHVERGAPRKPRRRQRQSGKGKRPEGEKQTAAGAEAPQQEKQATEGEPPTTATSEGPKAPARKGSARKSKPAKRASKKGARKKTGDKKQPTAQKEKKEKPKTAKKDAS